MSSPLTPEEREELTRQRRESGVPTNELSAHIIHEDALLAQLRAVLDRLNQIEKGLEALLSALHVPKSDR